MDGGCGSRDIVFPHYAPGRKVDPGTRCISLLKGQGTPEQWGPLSTGCLEEDLPVNLFRSLGVLRRGFRMVQPIPDRKHPPDYCDDPYYDQESCHIGSCIHLNTSLVKDMGTLSQGVKFPGSLLRQVIRAIVC